MPQGYFRSSIDKILLYGVAFSACRMLVGAISAVYLVALGVAFEQVALIKTFQAFCILVLDVPLAHFADTKSRRLSVLFSSIFAVLWLVVMANGQMLWHFYAAEFFNALSLSLFAGAFKAYLINEAKASGEDLQSLLGRLGKWQYAAMAVFSFAGAAFVDINSSLIWWIAAVLTFALIIGLGRLLPPDRHCATDETTQSLWNSLGGFWDSLKRDIFALAVLWVVALAVYYQVLIQFWQLMVYDHDNDLMQKGIFYAVVFAWILGVQSLAGYLCQKLQKPALLMGVGAALMMAWFIPSHAYGVVLQVGLLFFGVRVAVIVGDSILQSHIPSAKRSLYDAIISTTTRVVLLVVMPMVGLVFEWLGVKVFLWGIVVVFGVACLSYGGMRLLDTPIDKSPKI